MLSSSANLRYLAWLKENSPRRWPALVAGWAACTEARAQQLLDGRGLAISHEELTRIAASTLHSAEEIQFSELWRAVGDVFGQNLGFLLGSLEHGEQNELARQLGIHPTTISDWKKGGQRPRRHNLRSLLRYFGFAEGTDLENEPVFLDIEPRTHRARVAWIREMALAVEADQLRDMFPALKRLLEGK